MGNAISAESMGPYRVFAYGSLQYSAVLEAVLGRVPKSHRAVLYGYARKAIHDQVYPAVIRDVNARVVGVLLEGITEKELAALDDFEDPAYDRRLENVEIHGLSGVFQARLYARRNEDDEDLREEWDENAFEAGLAEYVERCKEWREVFERRTGIMQGPGSDPMLA